MLAYENMDKEICFSQRDTRYAVHVYSVKKKIWVRVQYHKRMYLLTKWKWVMFGDFNVCNLNPFVDTDTNMTTMCINCA